MKFKLNEMYVCTHDTALKVCQSNDLENQIHKQSWQEDRDNKKIHLETIYLHSKCFAFSLFLFT